MERSKHKTVQGIEKIAKELSKTNYIDWYANSAGIARSVESSGYTRSWAEARVKPYEVSGQVHDARSDESSYSSSV